MSNNTETRQHKLAHITANICISNPSAHIQYLSGTDFLHEQHREQRSLARTSHNTSYLFEMRSCVYFTIKYLISVGIKMHSSATVKYFKSQQNRCDRSERYYFVWFGFVCDFGFQLQISLLNILKGKKILIIIQDARF